MAQLQNFGKVAEILTGIQEKIGNWDDVEISIKSNSSETKVMISLTNNKTNDQ